MSAAARAGDLTSAESWFEKVSCQHRSIVRSHGKLSIRTLAAKCLPLILQSVTKLLLRSWYSQLGFLVVTVQPFLGGLDLRFLAFACLSFHSLKDYFRLIMI